MDNHSYGLRQKIGLFAGVLLFITTLLLPEPEGLSEAGWHAAAVGALMAVWWTNGGAADPRYRSQLAALEELIISGGRSNRRIGD